ncbi:MAG TPA: hypothetical protein VMD09_15230 [Solirubrobacteraceae bacterium]|nr:hypothetical protein [Solirubrobacteraceae bacterium]
MCSYHILLLPLAVVALVVGHVLLVRKHGVVPPFRSEDRLAALQAPTSGNGASASPDGSEASS